MTHPRPAKPTELAEALTLGVMPADLVVPVAVDREPGQSAVVHLSGDCGSGRMATMTVADLTAAFAAGTGAGATGPVPAVVCTSCRVAVEAFDHLFTGPVHDALTWLEAAGSMVRLLRRLDQPGYDPVESDWWLPAGTGKGRYLLTVADRLDPHAHPAVAAEVARRAKELSGLVAAAEGSPGAARSRVLRRIRLLHSAHMHLPGPLEVPVPGPVAAAGSWEQAKRALEDPAVWAAARDRAALEVGRDTWLLVPAIGALRGWRTDLFDFVEEGRVAGLLTGPPVQTGGERDYVLVAVPTLQAQLMHHTNVQYPQVGPVADHPAEVVRAAVRLLPAEEPLTHRKLGRRIRELLPAVVAAAL